MADKKIDLKNLQSVEEIINESSKKKEPVKKSEPQKNEDKKKSEEKVESNELESLEDFRQEQTDFQPRFIQTDSVETLGFNRDLPSGQSVGLENSLQDISTQKKEEPKANVEQLYSDARAMYEETESTRRPLQVGREAFRVERMNPAAATNPLRTVGMAHMGSETIGGEGHKAYEVKKREEKVRQAWEAPEDDRIKKYRG